MPTDLEKYNPRWHIPAADIVEQQRRDEEEHNALIKGELAKNIKNAVQEHIRIHKHATDENTRAESFKQLKYLAQTNDTARQYLKGLV